MILRSVSLLLVICCWVTGLQGQDSLASLTISTDQIRSLYEQAHYAEVVQLVKTELKRFPQQTPEQLVILLKYMGLSQVSQGDELGARQSFSTLLLVDPHYAFDSEEISPKIKSVFDSVAAEVAAPAPVMTVSPNYLILKDQRSELILRSVIFPGWGQWSQGQKRGYYWGVIFTTALIGSGISSYMTQVTREDYLKAYTPQDIAARYTAYNRWYQTRNTLLATILLSYTVNLADIWQLTR